MLLTPEWFFGWGGTGPCDFRVCNTGSQGAALGGSCWKCPSASWHAGHVSVRRLLHSSTSFDPVHPSTPDVRIYQIAEWCTSVATMARGLGEGAHQHPLVQRGTSTSVGTIAGARVIAEVGVVDVSGLAVSGGVGW